MSLSNIIDDGSAPLSWTKLKASSLKFSPNGAALAVYKDITVTEVAVTNCDQTATLRFSQVGKNISLLVLSSAGDAFAPTAAGATLTQITPAAAGAVGTALGDALNANVFVPVQGNDPGKYFSVQFDANGNIKFLTNAANPTNGDTFKSFSASLTSI